MAGWLFEPACTFQSGKRELRSRRAFQLIREGRARTRRAIWDQLLASSCLAAKSLVTSAIASDSRRTITQHVHTHTHARAHAESTERYRDSRSRDQRRPSDRLRGATRNRPLGSLTYDVVRLLHHGRLRRIHNGVAAVATAAATRDCVLAASYSHPRAKDVVPGQARQVVMLVLRLQDHR